jgi:tripartite-type tricarboxylate transporter receptor subunit TctC
VGFDVVAISPYGIAGPKGMDAGVVQVLHDTFKDALYDPAHVAVLDRFDMQIAYLNSEDYASAVRRQYEEERALARRFGWRPG